MKKIKNKNASISIIKFHRKRKGLCILCGMDTVNHPNNNTCIENYYKADMRNIDVIKLLPNEQINNNINTTNDININTTVNTTISNISNDIYIPKYKFIVLDITKSIEGYGVSFDFIKYLRHKTNKVIFLIGDFSKYSNFFKIQIQKFIGLSVYLNTKSDEETMKYILNCDKFYYLNSSRFKEFAETNNIPGDILISDKDDINLELVKQNPDSF